MTQCPSCKSEIEDDGSPFCPFCRKPILGLQNTSEVTDGSSGGDVLGEDVLAAPLNSTSDQSYGFNAGDVDLGSATDGGDVNIPSHGISDDVVGTTLDTKPSAPNTELVAGQTTFPANTNVTADNVTQSQASRGGRETHCVRCGCPSVIPVCSDCAHLPLPSLTLQVEGWEPVLYRGRKVMRVAITTDEIEFGRRDPAKGIWPHVDLLEIHAKEGDKSYLGRKHAKVIYERGGYFLVDVASQENVTQFAPSADADVEFLPREGRKRLEPGCRFVLGDVIGFRVLGPDETRES